MNSEIIAAILSYCEGAKREGVEYISLAFSPAGSAALFACRAWHRRHAECIAGFAAEMLARAGIDCVVTLGPCGGLWEAEVLPIPKEAA